MMRTNTYKKILLYTTLSLSIDEQKNKTCEKNTTKMELSIGYFVNMNFSNYLDYLGKIKSS